MSLLAAFAVPHPPLILPEIGRGGERKIQNTADAFRAAMRQAADLRPDTVVLASPHSVLYADYFHISPGKGAAGDFGQFGAPQVKIEVGYDTEFVSALEARCENEGLPAGTSGERNRKLDHGTLIPLRFLNEFYTDYKLVRIGLSGLSPAEHYRLGQAIAGTAEALGRRAVLIASGDLSHKLRADGPYGYAPEGPEFDRLVTESFGSGELERLLDMDPDFCEAAAECGLRSFQIMAGALDGKAINYELLSWEGITGVGYGVASFMVTGEDGSRRYLEKYEGTEGKRLAALKAGEDPLVRLARLAVETYVKTGKYAELPEALPPELLSARAGAFVSLKKEGRLRGCIGTIEPTQGSLAREILKNAVSAAVNDPRFAAVTREELPRLMYSVDVLGEPEAIESEAELDVRRYGVIVERGRRRGLLLPDLAGVDSVREQVEIARQKAGIAPGETVKLYRFQVVRHK